MKLPGRGHRPRGMLAPTVPSPSVLPGPGPLPSRRQKANLGDQAETSSADRGWGRPSSCSESTFCPSAGKDELSTGERAEGVVWARGLCHWGPRKRAGGCLLETSGRWKPFLTKAEHKEGALVFYMRSGPRVLYRDGLGGLGSLRLPPPGNDSTYMKHLSQTDRDRR